MNSEMALFRYFEKKPKVDKLPNPSGSLSFFMPSSSISTANSKVGPLLDEPGTATGVTKKRGHDAKVDRAFKLQYRRAITTDQSIRRRHWVSQ